MKKLNVHDKVNAVKQDRRLSDIYSDELSKRKVTFMPLKIAGKKVGIQKFSHYVNSIAVYVYDSFLNSDPEPEIITDKIQYTQTQLF